MNFCKWKTWTCSDIFPTRLIISIFHRLIGQYFESGILFISLANLHGGKRWLDVKERRRQALRYPNQIQNLVLIKTPIMTLPTYMGYIIHQIQIDVCNWSYDAAFPETFKPSLQAYLMLKYHQFDAGPILIFKPKLKVRCSKAEFQIQKIFRSKFRSK